MEKEITWAAPEFHYHEKDERWYWGVGIIALAIIIFALFQKNFLFAIFTAIAAVLVSIWGTRTPKEIAFTLSEKGLDIGGKKFYAYQSLSGFALLPSRDSDVHAEIILRATGRLGGWVKVAIGNDRSEEAKRMLARFLPEIEYEESVADHIARTLRF